MQQTELEELRALVLEKIKADRVSLFFKVMGWLVLLAASVYLLASNIFKGGVFAGLAALFFFSAYLCDLKSEQIKCKIRGSLFVKES